MTRIREEEEEVIVSALNQWQS